MAGRAIVVGISGGSAAGKTTFTEMLSEALAEYKPVVLNQDLYFRDWSILPDDQREKERTANHPRAVVWEQLVRHVKTLRVGEEIETPAPGTGRYARGERTERIRAGHLIMVEGHLIFGHEALRDLMDVKLFLDVDAHERVLRRMLRNTTSGMPLEDAVAWYRRDVIPNFPVYTEATRQYADLIVPFEGETQTAVDVVTSGLRAMIEKR